MFCFVIIIIGTKKEGLDTQKNATEEGLIFKEDSEKCQDKEWDVVVPNDGENTDNGAIALSRDKINDHPQTGKVFSYLQILTAIFGAFAHGGNDVR